MLKVIKSRKSKYYRVLLEGFGEDTVSSGFYSDNYQEMYNTANAREFGHIIIKKGVTGYYEILTGIKIPIIRYKRTSDNNTVIITPGTSYRAKNIVAIDDVYLENYIKHNDNDEFRENLQHFIQESDHNKVRSKSLNSSMNRK